MTQLSCVTVTTPVADALVLGTRPLRPGVELATTSRFGDDTWRLEPAILQQHSPSLALTFLTVPEAHRLVAKQLCYAMLTAPLPPGENRQSIAGVRSAFGELRKFLRWLDSRPPKPGHERQPDIASLIGTDLLDYQNFLMNSAVGNGSRENARRAVSLLWRYRQHLSDPLSLNPRHVDGWTFTKSRGKENATGRIPEPVLGPLITRALRFVDEFSADILAADAAWRDYRSRFSNGQTGRNGGLTELLATYLQEHVESARPLPGHRGKPNQRFIATEIGSNQSGLSRALLREMVSEAAAEVGVTEYTWLSTPITGRLDGRQWIEGIALRHPTLSIHRLARSLQVACYIAIAFLSGMRDSEVKHIQRGSLSTLRDSDGSPYRWKLSSLAFKGESDPAGVPASWVVGQPAARAVQILEKLQPADNPSLFSRLPHNSGSGSPRIDANKVLTSKTTNDQMSEFVDWINEYCRDHDRGDGIPLVNGQRWNLSTSQFRRTLAWFIARRPGGSIAGAIQYRHVSIQMFEGYAGTSESGFRAEVESEQALARGEHLLSLINHPHPRLVGPSASEAERRLEDFGGHARFAGIVATDSHRLKRLIQRHDPAIYPGTFATCVFNADRALCQPRLSIRGLSGPRLSDCQPLECSNVALTVENIEALRAELDQVDETLSVRPDLPPLLQHRLRSRRDQISRFIGRHRTDVT